MVNLRGLSVKTIAAVALVILAGAGGAYYYYMYLPQMEKDSAGAAKQAMKSPAVGKPAKTPNVQMPQAASAVPAVVAASAPMSVVAATTPTQPTNAKPNNVAATTLASPLKPAMQPAPELGKPEPAKRKSAAKKRRDKMPPAQPVNLASEPVVAVASQQIVPSSAVILPESGVAAAEPVGVITLKYNDLLTAVLRGDKDAVKQLLDFGRWVDKPGASGLTPLMAAVMNRDAQMVQLLLEHGAEPSVQALNLARKNKDVATVLLLENQDAR